MMDVLTSICLVALVVVGFFLWTRRWLYYYAWNMPGPFAWPLFGNVLELMTTHSAFYSVLVRFLNFPDIFRIWMGPYLVIVTTRPEHVQILLAECLEKSFMYKHSRIFLRDGLVVSPLNIWKGRRKAINKTFNQKVLDTYHDDLTKINHQMIEELEQLSEKGPIVMGPLLWRYAMYAMCETLLDVDATSVIGIEDYIKRSRQFQETSLTRFLTPWFHPDFLFKLSSLSKEMQQTATQMYNFINQIIELNKTTHINNDSSLDGDKLRRKRFLNYLLTQPELSQENVASEMQNMIIGGSETSTNAICFTLLFLAMYPQVQGKVHAELYALFGSDDRDATPEDVNKMEYLECVIKESMRLFTPIPLVSRSIDKTVRIGSQVYPAGSSVVFPFFKMHASAELWPNPKQFDPERFSAEEVEKREKGAYLPFSFGARNCPGWKFAMTSMKLTLSSLLRRFEVNAVNYKRIEDMEVVYGLLIHPKDECVVSLTTRKRRV